ncbi:MAG: hypothetical protein AVDCRST_MAG42-2508, partial [uncultured Chthoniobacterales bacterium]
WQCNCGNTFVPKCNLGTRGRTPVARVARSRHRHRSAFRSSMDDAGLRRRRRVRCAC